MYLKANWKLPPYLKENERHAGKIRALLDITGKTGQEELIQTLVEKGIQVSTEKTAYEKDACFQILLKACRTKTAKELFDLPDDKEYIHDLCLAILLPADTFRKTLEGTSFQGNLGPVPLLDETAKRLKISKRFIHERGETLCLWKYRNRRKY